MGKMLPKNYGTENGQMRKEFSLTDVSGGHHLPSSIHVLSKIFDDPDALDPKGRVPRDEDGDWNVEFVIRVDLKRESYCDTNKKKPLIVHDKLRVADVKDLMLQTLVWPSKFCYSAHIVQAAADKLIARSRTAGAKVLINTFFEKAESFGLREALSAPISARAYSLSTLERHLESAVETLIVGHEIGHLLAHIARGENEAPQKSASPDEELECDSIGFDLSLLFDESDFFFTAVDGPDGPEPAEHSAIDWVWGLFEHFATAVLWGDALLLRADKLCQNEFDDPFPFAVRRADAIVAKFRSSEVGSRHSPFRSLSLVPLQGAFSEINALITKPFDLRDSRFTETDVSHRDAPRRDYFDLVERWEKGLLSLGLELSLGNVIIPQAKDHPGMDCWLEFYQKNVTPLPDPPKYRGPILPGENLRHRLFGQPFGSGGVGFRGPRRK